jgi:hypothetical protein
LLEDTFLKARAVPDPHKRLTVPAAHHLEPLACSGSTETGLLETARSLIFDTGPITTHALILKCISPITNRILVGLPLSQDQEYLDYLVEHSKMVSRADLVINLSS